MKAHELAKKLLEGPDIDIVVMEEVYYEGASICLAVGIKEVTWYPTPYITSATPGLFIYAEGDKDAGS